MANVPAAAIDPYMLVLPDPCYSAEQFENFVLGIVGWSEALENSDSDFFISESCIGALFKDGWIPYTGRIDTLKQRYGLQDELDDFDEETLIVIAQGVLDKAPRLEERVGVEAVICDEFDGVLGKPTAIFKRLGASTAWAFKESMAMLALGLWHLHTLPNGCVFASVTSQEMLELTVFELSIIIEDAEFFLDSAPSLDFPLRIEESLHVCMGYKDYLLQIDSLVFWGKATSETDVSNAILSQVSEHESIGMPSSGIQPAYAKGLKINNQKVHFVLGSQFLTTVRDNGFDSRKDWAMLLIDTCARIRSIIRKRKYYP